MESNAREPVLCEQHQAPTRNKSSISEMSVTQVFSEYIFLKIAYSLETSLLHRNMQYYQPMGLHMERDLIDILAELQHRFTHHGGTLEGNVLERYFYFIQHSEYGKKCSFALKSRELFLRHDFEAVMKLVCEAADFYRDTMCIKPPEKPELSSSHGDGDEED
jgi:hypothetical protein